MFEKHTDYRGASKLLGLLKYLTFTFPGRVSAVRVRNYHMQIVLLEVHEDMVEMVTNRPLFQGMYIEVNKAGPVWHNVYIHIDLKELNNGLTGYFHVRQCWGLTNIEHWIQELETFLSDKDLRGKNDTREVGT